MASPIWIWASWAQGGTGDVYIVVCCSDLELDLEL